MPTTPNFGFTTPVAADPSDVPTHLATLASQVDAALDAHRDLTNVHGRNNAGPNPVEELNTDDAVFENTTYSPTAVATSETATLDVVGVAFTAPATGVVFIFLQALIESTSAGTSAICTFEVREGGSVGSGSIVEAAHIDHGVVSSMAVLSSPSSPARQGGCSFKRIAGLTPSSTYNVRVMHALEPAVTNGFGRIRSRNITVVPWLR